MEIQKEMYFQKKKKNGETFKARAPTANYTIFLFKALKLSVSNLITSLLYIFLIE